MTRDYGQSRSTGFLKINQYHLYDTPLEKNTKVCPHFVYSPCYSTSHPLRPFTTISTFDTHSNIDRVRDKHKYRLTKRVRPFTWGSGHGEAPTRRKWARWGSIDERRIGASASSSSFVFRWIISREVMLMPTKSLHATRIYLEKNRISKVEINKWNK